MGAVKSKNGSSGTSFGLVDLMFFLCCLICPLAVAVDAGGYFRSASKVKPGKLVKKFLLSAFSNVDSAGEYRAAWEKVIRSAMVTEVAVAALASMG